MASARWAAALRVAGVVAVAVGAAFQLSLLGRLFAATVRYPFDIEWLEGTALYQAHRMMRGLFVYGSPRDGYLPINHPPGYTAALSVIGRVAGLDYAMARTVSLLCLLGAMAVVGRALVRHAGGRLEGWALAVFAAGCAAAGVPLVDSFYTLVREDTMALLLCVGAAAIVDATLPVPGEATVARFQTRRLTPRRIAVLAGAITAIVYVRQPAVFFPVWIALFVFARHRPSGLLLALEAIAACGLVLVGLQFGSRGWYWLHTIGFVAVHEISAERFAKALMLLFALAPFIRPILVLAFVLAVFRKLSARTVLWVGMFLVSIPASLLPFAKVGGYSNDLIPSVFLLGPASAFVVADLLTLLADRPRARLALQTAIFAAAAAFLFLRKYDYTRFVPPEDSLRRARAVNARLASLEGGVVCSRHPFVPIQAGGTQEGWSDMPYLDLMWTGYTDLDLGGYIDRVNPRWTVVSGNEIPGTAKDIASRFQLVERLDGPTTLIGERSGLDYLMRRNDDEKTGHVLFDFESLDGWTLTGDAFHVTTSKPDWESAIHAVIGKHLANSYTAKAKDGARGTALSPKFVVDRDHMSLRVGGGFHAGTRVELRVGGRMVRSATGIFEAMEVLTRVVWDVSPWRGKEAQLVLIDEDTGYWAHLLCDHVVLY